MDRLSLEQALDHLLRALESCGIEPRDWAPFVPAAGRLRGAFEVRAADGRVRRLQSAELALPPSLLRALAHRAPPANVAIDLGSHTLTLWAPGELIELQVGYRWHGFNGRRLREWDDQFVVFAEDGGDPLALRLDEDPSRGGPVWLSHRGEGRHAFFEAAPSLSAFYEALALFLEARTKDQASALLRGAFGPGAEQLWIWRAQISGLDARR